MMIGKMRHGITFSGCAYKKPFGTIYRVGRPLVGGPIAGGVAVGGPIVSAPPGGPILSSPLGGSILTSPLPGGPFADPPSSRYFSGVQMFACGAAAMHALNPKKPIPFIP
jgi:hypothetical protein